MKKPTQKTIFKILEEELVTVLAVSLIGLSMLFVQAGTTTLSVTINPAPGAEDPVTNPSGGVGSGITIPDPLDLHIDEVEPVWVVYGEMTELTIRGTRFEAGARVLLERGGISRELVVTSRDAQEIIATIRSNVPIGEYVLVVRNPYGARATYSEMPITIYSDDTALVTPPTTGGDEGYYSATWVRQSDYLKLRRGEEATLWVEFKNTGTLPWLTNPGNENPVRLGTNRPQDRLSMFRNGDWVLPNRPSNVNRIVNPGEVGRFSFAVKAPERLGRYREYFSPVAEFYGWMEDQGVYWDLTVSLTPNRGQTHVEPKAPSTGGTIAPQPVKRSTSMPVKVTLSKNFADGPESVFRGLTGWAESLFENIVDMLGRWF